MADFLVEGLQKLVGDLEDHKLLSHAVSESLDESAALLKERAIAIMNSRFKNPSGHLASETYVILESMYPLYQSSVVFDSPYGWRRDRGFSDMVDSLGRYYPNDPGVHYAEDAIDESLEDVRQIFVTNLNEALHEMGSTYRIEIKVRI
jgi:hypothetical protein